MAICLSVKMGFVPVCPLLLVGQLPRGHVQCNSIPLNLTFFISPLAAAVINSGRWVYPRVGQRAERRRKKAAPLPATEAKSIMDRCCVCVPRDSQGAVCLCWHSTALIWGQVLTLPYGAARIPAQGEPAPSGTIHPQENRPRSFHEHHLPVPPSAAS